MAGKTFTGIGLEDLLKEKAPLPADAAADAVPVNPGEGEDHHTVNSEPTIVDAEKVAEGLSRLRALQTIHGMPVAPGAPADAPPELVADMSSSEPTRLGMPRDARPELVADMSSSEPTRLGLPAARPTAVGRTSDLEPPGKQVIVPPDLRATMFGHTVHVPELHERLDAEDAPSGPIYVAPPQAGAATTQLVRYQPQPPAPRMPSFHGVEPYPRRPGYSAGAYPVDERDSRTETIPPLGRRGYARAILVMFALVVAALATLAFMRYRADADDVRSAPENASGSAAPADTTGTTPSPSGAASAHSAPTKTPPGATPPTERAPPAGPAAGARPSAAEPAATAPARPRPPAEATPASERAPAETGGFDSRRRPGRSDRRRAAPADVPDDAAARAKPTKKGAVGEDDPDATLPPSSAE